MASAWFERVRGGIEGEREGEDENRPRPPGGARKTFTRTFFRILYRGEEGRVVGGLHPQPDLKSRAIGRAVGDGRARQRRRSRGAPGGRARRRGGRGSRVRDGRNSGRPRVRTGGLEHEGHDVAGVVRLHRDDVVVAGALEHLGLRSRGARARERDERSGEVGETRPRGRIARRDARRRPRAVAGASTPRSRGGSPGRRPARRAHFFKTNAFSPKDDRAEASGSRADAPCS